MISYLISAPLYLVVLIAGYAYARYRINWLGWLAASFLIPFLINRSLLWIYGPEAFFMIGQQIGEPGYILFSQLSNIILLVGSAWCVKDMSSREPIKSQE